MSENEKFDNLADQVSSLKSLVIAVLKKTQQTSELIDSNFDLLNTRIDELESKIDSLAKTTGNEFEGVGGKLNDIHHELKKIEKVSRYSEEFENLLKIS